MGWFAALCAAMLLCLGCPDDDDDAADDDDTADDDDDSGDDDDDDIVHAEGFIGGLQVNHQIMAHADGSEDTESHIASVWGFWEQPWPGEIFGLVQNPIHGATGWEVSDEGEDCGRMTFDFTYCEPECTFDEYCDPVELECRPYPAEAGAGALALQGPGLALVWTAGEYWNQEVPAGSVSPGDLIEFTATGDATPAFAVSTAAVSPLQPDLECHPTGLGMVPGEDMMFSWTPAGDGRIRLEVIAWNHGGAKDRIYCDVADNGSLTVPADLVDSHMLGDDEFHGLFILTRYSQSLEDIGGDHKVGLELANSWMCYSWY